MFTKMYLTVSDLRGVTYMLMIFQLMKRPKAHDADPQSEYRKLEPWVQRGA